ncbi:hypothetical protein E2562_039060 [Oryza meyeriana var. granulata]|uniref:Alcohol dehydrogenase-like C-terminal domain-containing protein n=1 Tax=Oryza meyeriana var. granulata TaxID=110450 RepID=A0A6G1EUM1_9ORYZ|nr:hypothetical protein E2562_039060 [Oryza meyeriana var. granulata]
MRRSFYPRAGVTHGGTVLQSLRVIGAGLDGPPKNVLVTVAFGGVGHIVVLLTKLGGHHVVATCNAYNLCLFGNLGVDEALDYDTPEGTERCGPGRCTRSAA